MGTAKTIVTIIYVIICVALTVIVLMQEGKNAGLSGTIDGIADSYWGKNKGRSVEGTLVKVTRILALLFIVLSVVLSMQFWTK
ncbi:MAG: preprotein translocase subunit SecG [Lachnospiraceae bacterium]|nr:preprotein translocase subunit SecG [Lachnospiraceae bacterium]